MIEPDEVVTIPARVTTELAALGLTDALLRDAVAAGMSEASRTTLNDPKTAFGYLFWQTSVRVLREALTSSGSYWERRDDRGFPTVLNKQTGIAIGVSSGDPAVGKADETPRTRNSKGAELEEIISRNQLSFYDVYELSDGDLLRPTVQAKETRLLIYYFDPIAHETRLELALPMRMAPDGVVTGWQRRVVLEPISHRPAPVIDPEDGEIYNTEVRPKSV